MFRYPMSVVLLLFLPSLVMGQLPPTPELTPQKNQPRLFVEQRMQELGNILEGSVVPLSWRLENHGDADLVIYNTKATCGCTLIKLKDEDKVIPPGGSIDVEADFHSKGRRGDQKKSVTVFSNDPAEPKLKLKFQAHVYYLFNVIPPGLVNLGSLQRGQTASKTIDIVPAEKNQMVDILQIVPQEEALFRFHAEPLKQGSKMGQRIHVTAANEAPMGKLRSGATVTFEVAGITFQHEIVIRGVIVDDLSWQPRVIDTTRHVSLPGKQLQPVIIHSTDKNPFDIVEVQPGGMFVVSYDMLLGSPRRTRYRVKIGLREDVSPGPFGEYIRIITSDVDQPVIEIPVFGIVSKPLEVDPPIIYLVQNGTPKGIQRLVKIMAPVRSILKIADIQCSNKAVTAQINWEETARYRHIRYLDVWLSGTLPEGTHQTTLTMSTTIEGFELLEIPVTIRVPKK